VTPQEHDPTSLSLLHDLALPEPAPWWPLAPGWQALGAVATGLAVVLIVLTVRRHLRNAYRREARAELASLRARGDVTALPALVRRVALAAWPRPQVASLTGASWISFLNGTTPSSLFPDDLGGLWLRLAYDPQAAAGLDDTGRAELFAAAERWIATHRVPASTTAQASSGNASPPLAPEAGTAPGGGR
jgi:hypothetical protein